MTNAGEKPQLPAIDPTVAATDPRCTRCGHRASRCQCDAAPIRCPAAQKSDVDARNAGLRPTSAAPITRVVHNKREAFDIYIGRPSKWGNPFSHKDGTLAQFRVASVEDAIAAYEEWIKTQPELLAALPELRGKVLGCWCAPGPCHGDVLARMANGE